MTVWLPLADLEPDHPPDALHVTGLVALLFTLHIKVTLCPLVIWVELALKLTTGATAFGVDGGGEDVDPDPDEPEPDVLGGGVLVVPLPLEPPLGDDCDGDEVEVDVGGGVDVVVDGEVVPDDVGDWLGLVNEFIC